MSTYEITRELEEFLSLFALWSVGSLIGSAIYFKAKHDRTMNVYFYGSIVILATSAGILIGVLFNKEMFHWNYDIATGLPVDHYSNYGRCIGWAIAACVCSPVNIVLGCLYRKRRGKEPLAKYLGQEE